jgi:hypothetical protein
MRCGRRGETRAATTVMGIIRARRSVGTSYSLTYGREPTQGVRRDAVHVGHDADELSVHGAT